MMKNKRGQGLSTNAIILLVLGVVILAILIAGFAAGWSKIVPWISPPNNVDTIVQACETSCLTSNVYDFCSFQRTLKADDLPDADSKEVENTCQFFSTNEEYSKYGVQDCPGLCSTQ
jgi:hypothetical protein